MSPLDPLMWSDFAQGLFVGVMLVLGLQTAWRYSVTNRREREASWRHVRDDYEPIRHVWLVHETTTDDVTFGSDTTIYHDDEERS